jgi:hypothetical protein
MEMVIMFTTIMAIIGASSRVTFKMRMMKKKAFIMQEIIKRMLLMTKRVGQRLLFLSSFLLIES